MVKHPFFHIKSVLQQAGITPGRTVAVQGVGHSGHVPRLAADLVGRGGHVYAVDVHAGFVNGLQKYCAAFDIQNITPVWADFEGFCGVPVRPETLDAVAAVHMGWRTKNAARLAKEARRLLKPSGVFVVADWTPDSVHPLASKQFVHEESRRVLGRMQDAGFSGLGRVHTNAEYWFAVLKKG